MVVVEADVVAITHDAVAGGAVVAGLVVIGVVVLVATARRRNPSDASAVSGYRHTLETLGRVHEGRTHHADRRFAPRHPERSLAAMGRKPRRWGIPVLAAIVVLAAVGGLVYLGTRHTPKTARADDGAPAAHATGARHRRHSTTTTTAPPVRYAAIASTASSATFAPDQSSYTLTIAATSGDCWVSVTSSAGATLLEETLPAGTSKSVAASGRTTMVIGAPTSAALSIGGVPAALPTGVVGPFTVSLDPK